MGDRFEHDVGDRIGGKRGEYRVKQRLGAGGMGACYLVEDTDAPRQYVLKTMQSRLAQKKSALDAFELEARGLIALHACPNVVQVYHLDYARDGVPFYLMEVLSGLSVREMLHRRTRLHAEAVVGIGIGIAKALVFAHDKQVVHCDLKPDNVFAVRTEEGTVVKLIDFGVMTAHLVRAGYHGAGGTPSYMAPEQLRGEPVDTRADIFAFGVMLYEMLVGMHPFADFGLDEKGALARVNAMPPSIAEALPEMPWKLSNHLDHLLEKMLHPSRALRCGDASEVLVKLHQAERIARQLAKGDVHAATTNPGAPPEQLLAQTTGVVDEDAVAARTNPNLDLASEPELAAAVAQTVEASTSPPSRPLPEPDRRNVNYVSTPPSSYDRAVEAAQMLEPAPASLELTSGEREFVDNLAKHVEEQSGGVRLGGTPRPAATVVEGEDYHRRLSRGRLPLPLLVALAALGVALVTGIAIFALSGPGAAGVAPASQSGRAAHPAVP